MKDLRLNQVYADLRETYESVTGEGTWYLTCDQNKLCY